MEKEWSFTFEFTYQHHKEKVNSSFCRNCLARTAIAVSSVNKDVQVHIEMNLF